MSSYDIYRSNQLIYTLDGPAALVDLRPGETVAIAGAAEMLSAEEWASRVAAEPVAPEQVARWQAVRALRETPDPNAVDSPPLPSGLPRVFDQAPQGSCLHSVALIWQMMAQDPELANLAVDLEESLNDFLYWHRGSTTLMSIAAILGWSAAFVDGLFIRANSYQP